MAYWLLKTEPEEFFWDDQLKSGAKGEAWTGVKTSRRVTKIEAAARSRRRPRYLPDELAGMYKPLKKPVTLAAIKAEPKLKDMALVKYSRLSVQPVTAEEWKLVCKMGGLSAR